MTAQEFLAAYLEHQKRLESIGFGIEALLAVAVIALLLIAWATFRQKEKP